MPFCTQCGHRAGASDLYCANCGAKQGGPPLDAGGSQAHAADPLSGMSSRTAAILCYVPGIGWIPAVIVLAARKFKTDHAVRFHAFQGLYLFAASLFVNWVVRPIATGLHGQFLRIDQLLGAVIVAVSIFMMVKASHNEPYVLPIIGELAQRSAIEQ